MKLVKADDILEKSHDVTLEGGAKHRCFDTTRLFEIPTVDTLVWTPVTTKLPDEDREYLVTVKQWYDNDKDAVHYSVGSAHFSQNLQEYDPYCFPDKNRPGWCNFDDYREEFFDLEWDTGPVHRKVTAWMENPKPYKEGD